MQNIDQFELRQGGRDDAAVETLQEDVAKIRTQRQAQPQFEVEQALAIALVNYSNALRDAKKLGQALAAVEESVSIWRLMHETWPEKVEANLANTLQLFCYQLGEAGREEEAVKAAEESIRLYRSLHKAEPEAFGRSLAIALMSYSNSLSRSKKVEDALQAIEESVAIYRGILKTQSAPADGIYAKAAKAVMIQSCLLAEVHRTDDALTSIAQASLMLRSLSEDEKVAKGLIWRPIWLAATGRNEEMRCRRTGARLVGRIPVGTDCDAEQLLAHPTVYAHGMNLLQRMDIRHDDRAPTFRITPFPITPPERRFKADITTISMRSVCIAGTTRLSVDIADGLALSHGPCLP